mmetsp:Transcript_11151/g.15340  ORF Transcript_11151/g.15340 Transcript_11151/m.15340 type:complete len:686 (+) Transcript_11151:91-2148(+)|eukprot:CAMPEP_0197288978 /NCGR_PEP_ID=MMETSP0890-20130614/6185_1 /TAXON_ID=44058 ORGANISM="Aureoumbra lagunensis, Strain CCMP1510" /NCGR_SAMPLE_ID=MMETSP0890 /ASSEMBLY_ACC=CAM_ASM_000533 /LENGTH=685 /DNA_ID=CAMNT_0042760089 /DNA_START=43 /DNA_END=2100 /DNA_ORIENTATION=-
MAPLAAGKRMIEDERNEVMLKVPPPLHISDEPKLIDEPSNDSNTLFVFEVYVHAVEGLPRRIQHENLLPGFAVQLLDFAPVIIAPPSTNIIKNRQGAVWYGTGKRCLFEEKAQELDKALKVRGSNALLILEIEHNEADKRKLYGSATIDLNCFSMPTADQNEPYNGAVHAWGRIETRVVITNPRGKEVGIITLSASLSSLDKSLRPVVAQQVTSSRDSCHLDNIRESADTGVSNSPDASNSKKKPFDQDDTAKNDEHDRQLLAVSVALSNNSPTHSDSLRSLHSSCSQRPATPGINNTERCVDATLRMSQLSPADFDATRQSLLIEAVATRADIPVHRAQILAWREGSLIVDIRVHFYDNERRKAQRFAEKLAASNLLPKQLFGECELLELAYKSASPTNNTTTNNGFTTTQTNRHTLNTPPSSEGTAQKIPRPPTAPNRVMPHTLISPTKHFVPVPPPGNRRRSLDSLRSAGANFDDDQQLCGDCPPPLFHAATTTNNIQLERHDNIRNARESNSLDAVPSNYPGNYRSTLDSRSSRGSFNTCPPRRLVRTRSHRSNESNTLKGQRQRLDSDSQSEESCVTPLDDNSWADRLQVIPNSVLSDNANQVSVAHMAPRHSPELEHELKFLFNRIQGDDGKVSIRELRACVKPGSVADEFLVEVRNYKNRLDFDELLLLADSTYIGGN